MIPPKCSNPNCNVQAIILVGRYFYCGDCAMKIIKMKEKEEKERIDNMFLNEEKTKNVFLKEVSNE